MVAAVVERHLHIHQRVAGQNSQLDGSLHALVDGLDEFLGHRTALDLVDKLVALARHIGLDAQLAVAVVARAAGLANVLALRLGLLADSLAEGHLGLAHIGFHLVLAPHAVNQNLQMQLAHATNNRLPRLIVGPHLEGWILIGQPRECHAHLFLVGLGLGLNSHRDHRLRECNRAQSNGMMRSA